MAETNIEKTTVSLRTMAIVIFFTVSFTGTIVTAWMTILHASERTEYVNDRIDKKTGRNEEAIEALEKRVTALESPGSDTE